MLLIALLEISQLYFEFWFYNHEEVRLRTVKNNLKDIYWIKQDQWNRKITRYLPNNEIINTTVKIKSVTSIDAY